MHTFIITDVPTNMKDRADRKHLAEEIEIEDIDGNISYEYEISFKDWLKLGKPYHVNKRPDGTQWYMCWWTKATGDRRKSLGTTSYKLAEQRAGELFEEMTESGELAG